MGLVGYKSKDERRLEEQRIKKELRETNKSKETIKAKEQERNRKIYDMFSQTEPWLLLDQSIDFYNDKKKGGRFPRFEELMVFLPYNIKEELLVNQGIIDVETMDDVSKEKLRNQFDEIQNIFCTHVYLNASDPKGLIFNSIKKTMELVRSELESN